jgi:beta-lactamase class A
MEWNTSGSRWQPQRLRVLFVLCALALGRVATGTLAGEKKDARLEAARTEIEKRIAASGAEVSLAFRTLDHKAEILIRPDVSYHAASTMKVAVMLELFRQAHQGKLRLEDSLPVHNEFLSLVDGSPFQLDPTADSDPDVYKKEGSEMSLRELCEAMITRSSNLAANLLIVKLGVDNIRSAVAEQGAKGLEVLRPLEDAKAFQKGLNNTTTARALLILLERIARHQAVDRRSCEEMIAILKRQTLNEAIPAGLPPGTVVAHKTGEITRIHHDAAIVYGRKTFVLVLLVRGIEDRVASAALMADLTRIVDGVVDF